MIGIHIAKDSKIRNEKSKTMEDAIKRDIELLNINSCQIFTHGPRSYNRNQMDYIKIKKYCQLKNINISSHGSYLSVGIWKVNESNKNTAISKKNIAHIADMLKSINEIGGSGVVLHLPNNIPDVVEETMRILSENEDIKRYNKNADIILEMPASKPDHRTYETSEKLQNLCDKLKDININWSLCIDTSHQWSCGIKMNEPLIWHKWLSGLTDYVRNKIKIIHLNGNSLDNFGRGKDIHEIIMSPDDGIWGNLISEEMKDFIDREEKEIIKSGGDFFSYLSAQELSKINDSSLAEIIRYAKKNNIVLIMEINRGKFIYTKFAIDIIKSLLSN